MTSLQKALLSACTPRYGRVVRTPHGVPAGLALIGANLAGLVLTGGVVAREVGHVPVLGATTVPDQASAEEQPPPAANATAGSIRTYRYEPRTTGPTYPTTRPPLLLLHGDGLTGEAGQQSAASVGIPGPEVAR